jgi:formylglycine-generating enzyme required for sulfatase activity
MDFRKVINDALRGTDALIAIVGPNWRGTSEGGSARISDANDPVRIEVETALQRDIPVIPVLVGGAIMPKPTELPESLSEFSFRNAAYIDSGRNFDTDVERLVRSMDRVLEEKVNAERIVQTKSWLERRPSRRAVLTGGGLAGVMLVVAAIAMWLGSNQVLRQADISRPPRPLMHDQPASNDVPLSQERERALKSKETFKECVSCPEMVVVPAGNFTMGSPNNEKWRNSNEAPQHRVTIAKPVAISKFEITFNDWDACAAPGDCDQHISDNGWGRGRQPVVNVTWDHTQRYVAWLSKVTGKPYRLLSEAEWEYAARAGTETPYFWGDQIGNSNANCTGCGSQWDGKQPAAVGSFAPNQFDLYDMHGNVKEWVQDCYLTDYSGTPTDGSAWTAGECQARVFRGGSWASVAQLLRSAYRGRGTPNFRNFDLGFRVGRTLTP